MQTVRLVRSIVALVALAVTTTALVGCSHDPDPGLTPRNEDAKMQQMRADKKGEPVNK